MENQRAPVSSCPHKTPFPHNMGKERRAPGSKSRLEKYLVTVWKQKVWRPQTSYLSWIPASLQHIQKQVSPKLLAPTAQRKYGGVRHIAGMLWNSSISNGIPAQIYSSGTLLTADHKSLTELWRQQGGKG